MAAVSASLASLTSSGRCGNVTRCSRRMICSISAMRLSWLGRMDWRGHWACFSSRITSRNPFPLSPLSRACRSQRHHLVLDFAEGGVRHRCQFGGRHFHSDLLQAEGIQLGRVSAGPRQDFLLDEGVLCRHLLLQAGIGLLIAGDLVLLKKFGDAFEVGRFIAENPFAARPGRDRSIQAP